LHWLFQFGFDQVGGGIQLSPDFVAAVIAAPLVEELSKGLGLGGARKHMGELEDGIIYGAAIGLGFAATENLVYGFAGLLEGGAELALTTIVMRSLSSMFLHGAATALLGYGYSLYIHRKGSFGAVLMFYLAAVGLHAAFNFLVGQHVAFGLIWAVLMVAIVMSWARKKIESLDAASGW
jgi:RsiW-degrading membrane proteinase PrsW (M82 family)